MVCLQNADKSGECSLEAGKQPVTNLEAAACLSSSVGHAAPPWYALFVLPTWIFRVEVTLEAFYGIETFVPLYDGRQVFPGYIFARMRDSSEVRKALGIPGSNQFLPNTILTHPSIADEEVMNLRKALASTHALSPLLLSGGSPGADDLQSFKGTTGAVMESDGKRGTVCVGIEMLGRGIPVTVDLMELEAAA